MQTNYVPLRFGLLVLLMHFRMNWNKLSLSLTQWWIFDYHYISYVSLTFENYFPPKFLGRSLWEGNGNPVQYSCLENPMEGGSWLATVHGSQRVGHDWITSLSLSKFLLHIIYSKYEYRCTQTIRIRWTVIMAKQRYKKYINMGNLIEAYVNFKIRARYWLLLDHRKSKRVPEKHLFLFYWLCQSLWLCGSQ